MTDIVRMTKVVNLKMTPAQLRACKAAARAAGKHLSAWARDTLVEHAIFSDERSASRMAAPQLPKVFA